MKLLKYSLPNRATLLIQVFFEFENIIQLGLGLASITF